MNKLDEEDYKLKIREIKDIIECNTLIFNGKLIPNKKNGNMDFKSNFDSNKWFKEWNDYSKGHNKLVNERFEYLGKLGLEVFSISEIVLRDNIKLGEKVDTIKEFREIVKEISGEMVKAIYDIKKVELIRFLSATLTKIQNEQFRLKNESA